jgi:hypothetical protein
VRNLDQYACAVARRGVATAGASMRQVDEDLDTLQDDVMRLLAFDVCDKTDTTSVMFVPRIV